MAMKVKDDLLKHGSVKRGWLGVRIQDVSAEHAKSFNLAKATGVLVASVEQGRRRNMPVCRLAISF